MKPAFVIRPATVADSHPIAATIRAAWQTAYDGIIDPAYPPTIDVDRMAAFFVRNIQENQETILVAALRVGIAGFIAGNDLSAADHDCEIKGFYLRPEYQRQNIGKQLFAALADEFRRQGKKRMLAVTLRGAANNGFYRHLGGREQPGPDLTIGKRSYAAVHFMFPITST